MSRSIGRSPLLSDFLLYVCDRHLREKTSELTEQRIGVKVFGRTEGYNSNDDNIVRNYARTLRKRVDDYFATEGRHEDLRLEIPRGGYVPVFSPNLPERSQTQETFSAGLGAYASSVFEEPAIEPKDTSQDIAEPARVEIAAVPTSDSIVALPLAKERTFSIWSRTAAALAVIAVLAFGAERLWHFMRDSSAVNAATIESDLLWSQLFQKDRDTFVVPADSGLVILQGLTHQPVTLGDYASGGYRAAGSTSSGLSSADINELGTRRYTSIVDLKLVSHLSQLKEIVPERMLIRYARDLRMDDLRSANVILLGSVDSNPWEELFQQQLNFRFMYSPKSDTAPVIINQHPLPGEQLIYANKPSGGWHNTYGIIAYLPNLEGSGHVLLVGGLNMAGTQAAGDFVLNPALMKTTLEHARGSNGNLRPFEILIGTDNVAANSSRPHVISERIGPS